MNDRHRAFERVDAREASAEVAAFSWRPHPNHLPRFAYWLGLVFACLSLDCRTLTAQPSPAPRPATFEIAETLY